MKKSVNIPKQLAIVIFTTIISWILFYIELLVVNTVPFFSQLLINRKMDPIVLLIITGSLFLPTSYVVISIVDKSESFTSKILLSLCCLALFLFIGFALS